MKALGLDRKEEKKRGKRAPQGGAAAQRGTILLSGYLSSHTNTFLLANTKPGANETVALVEEGKAKERYDKLKEMLNKGKVHHTQVANEVDNIQLTEKILNEYRKIYRSQYGAHLAKVPPYLESSDEYMQVCFNKK